MIRVLLVDDQALVRSGFRIILDTQPDITVIGEAADGAEAVRLAADLSPDVICMDVEMPMMDGIEASRRIRAASAVPASEDDAVRAPAILILTTFGHDAYLFDALAVGVSGFLLKTSRAEQLCEAVRTLAAGDALLGPDVTRAVMAKAADRAATFEPRHASASAPQHDQHNQHNQHNDPAAREAAMTAAGLTDREREVLQLIASGRTNGEIAAELFLGEATVKTHVSKLLQKLGARDRVQLVVWALTRGAGLH